jgi:formamidopyrimidine-DNA glycosylase
VPTVDHAAAGWGTDAALLPSQVAHIARDPLDPAFDDRLWRATLARKNSAVKRVLLDQTVVSGVGNIYADESLWAARIHPETPANLLSTRAARRLLTEVRAVLEKALAEGGTSFDAQYVNVNGQAGYFAHSLNAYGRTGQPCARCGRPIVRDAFMNRSSHFCRHCQRLALAARVLG